MARTNSLPTTSPAKALPPAAQRRRDSGPLVSAPPAVRRYRTSHEAVRSPRRLGEPAKIGRYGAVLTLTGRE